MLWSIYRWLRKKVRIIRHGMFPVITTNHAYAMYLKNGALDFIPFNEYIETLKRLGFIVIA